MRIHLPVLICAALGLGACKSSGIPSDSAGKPAATAEAAAPAPAGPVVVNESVLQFFKPLPARFESESNPITPEKVALGRMLFYETRLSKNHDLSCNSCHGLETYGVDNAQFSSGHKKQLGGRNSPTVYNAGAHIAQFWDGRAADLEEQAKGPILNAVEMAMPDEAFVLRTLTSIPGYVDAFAKAFPGEKQPVNYDNMARAIGAFERQLVTPSRFDAFLQGDATALTDEEKRGLVTFKEMGCTTCHNGVAVGGSSFQKLGLIHPYPDTRDEGRFAATKDPAHKMFFRVPTLRNVEKTAPYFHDGSIPDLETVVRKMAWHQLGKEASDAEVASIVAFLKSLTGEIPTDYIARPELPPSGPKTPKPDPA